MIRERFRILLIHNFYQYWGGEDNYVICLKKLLEENGHKVYLYSKDSKNIKTAWDKIKAGMGLFYNPRIKKELEKIIVDFKPDIAHFHNIYPLIGATAYRICKKFNIKIVQHIHNYRFMCPKGTLFRDGKICELCLHQKFPFWSIVFGCYHQSSITSLFLSLSFYFHKLIKTFEMIDKYIFPSEFTRKYYLKHLKINKERTFFLPYFVELPKKLPEKVKKKDYFLYVGRLSEEKGITQLLKVFKDLADYKLVIIGDGPLRKKIEKYRKYRNIEILGFKPREIIFEYISKAKAIIIPSLWYEVLPLILIESITLKKIIYIPNSKNFKTIIKNFRVKKNKLPKQIVLCKFNNINDIKLKITKYNKKFKNVQIYKNKQNFVLFHPYEHCRKIFEIYRK